MPSCTLNENQIGSCVVPSLQLAQHQGNENLQLQMYTQLLKQEDIGKSDSGPLLCLSQN